MNTIIRFQIISSKGTIFTKNKAKEAFGCFEEVVNKFSRFSPKSELSLMNDSSGKVFKASPELFKLIKYSLYLNKLGSGNYDPTVIDLLESYGYDKTQDFSKLEEPDFYKEIKNLVLKRNKASEIVLDEKKNTVKLKKGQRLDMGSIAKGYAVDLAYEKLKKDFDHFLINAGGDVRVSGLNEQGLNWKIMLYRSALPNGKIDDTNFIGMVTLEPGQSIAGSGGWARRVGAFHHLLSPKDGFPINQITQTYVIAPTATDADAFSTFLYVEGPDALSIINDRDFSGLLIDFQGNIFKSKKFNYS